MSRASATAILYRAELWALVRDRRTLFLSLVLPLFAVPLLFLASGALRRSHEQRAEAKTYAFAIAGSQAQAARELVTAAVSAARERRDSPDRTEALALEEIHVPDPAAALREEKLDFYIEALTADEAHPAAPPSEPSAPPDADSDDGEPRAAPGVPVIAFFYRQDRTASRAAYIKVRRLLVDLRSDRRLLAVAAKGLVLSPSGALPLERVDIATEEARSGLRVGRFLTLLVVLCMMAGGASVAADSIAGGKERGTLETLLTTGASRTEIIAGKLLVILTVTVVTATIQVSNLLLWSGLGLADPSTDIASGVPPLTALLLLGLYLPVALLIASVLLLTSGIARTAKEAQLYYMPVMLAGTFLSLAPSLPGIDLRSAIVLVPLVNIGVAVKEVLSGETDPLPIATAWLITAAAALQIARVSVRLLSVERLITSADKDESDHRGGPALFPRRALRWFAVLWAVAFVASLSAGPAGIRGGVLLGQGLLLAASFLMIRVYRLNIREALSLRPVNPLVWPAVLLGAPSAMIVGMGLFRLVNLFLPIPPRLLEAFAKALTPDVLPFWQLVFFIAILPGICEEIAFRGLLLHALRRRLRPFALCLTVGLIFGLFHLALFRLATTAFLGVLLSAVALLTGSIFPGMLWHMLNNALSLLAIKANIPLENPPLWSYPAALLTLSLSFFLLWKSRAQTEPT